MSDYVTKVADDATQVANDDDAKATDKTNIVFCSFFKNETEHACSQRGQCILFSVVFSHSPHSHHGSVWVLCTCHLSIPKKL